MNLTPEQLAELQRLFSTPVGGGLDNAYMPNTVDYGGQSWKRDDAGGFAAMGPLYGDNQYKYTNYDAGGAQTAEGDARLSDWSPELGFLTSLGALVGGGLAMGGPGAFGFGGAAGGGGGGMVNGAFLGEAPWTATGGGALDFGAGTSAIGAGTGGAGSGAFLGEGVASGVPAWDAAATKAGLSLTGAGGGLLSGLSGSNLLGAGATLLGAAAGAKGQEQSTSTAKDIPEWLKPSVMKQLGYAGGLLDKQMAPGYMAGYDQMRTIGQGLLNQPIAGNGFDMFMQRPRFGGQ